MRWIIVFFLLVAASIVSAEVQLVEVTAAKLNVRTAPSARAPIVDQVTKGDQLVVMPVSDRWAAIPDENEIKGYLSIRYVKAIESQNELGNGTVLMSLFLLAVAFLVAVAGLARSKKKSAQRKPECVQDHSKVGSASPKESQKNTPNARRNFESDSQTTVQFRVDGGKKIQDLPVVKVERVIDGDTVIVSSTWRKERIRLDSIDCPEDGQPWGEVATAGLIKMIGGQKVRIEEHCEDHYGRLVATIYVQEKHRSDWVNVNEKMVVKGHAWVMRKYYDHLPADRKDKLNRLEKWARVKKVGLWKTPNPIPPWKWRRVCKVPDV